MSSNILTSPDGVLPLCPPISPITQSNWEGVGVVPDIAATSDQALAVAKDQLQRRLHASAALVAMED